MAHPNIIERQAFVSAHVKQNGIPDNKTRVEMAKQFACSSTAIYADVIWHLKPNRVVLYPNKRLKQEIKERDDHACQYCGTQEGNIEIDHVIPTILSGPAKDYNLVCACHSCNLKKKGGKVWIPMNIEVLRSLNDRWADKIESLSIKNCSIEAILF